MKRAFAIATLAMVAGCLPTATLQRHDYYVLDDAGGPSKSGKAAERVLLVSPVTTSAFYDTQRLAYSSASGQRAYYQFASWTERPGRRFTELLVHRLAAGGRFHSVATTTAGVSGDLILNVRLDEIYHDAASTPGSAHIEATAELIDHARRSVLARRTFVATATVTAADAKAAVAGLDSAVTGLLDQMEAWIDATAAASPPP